MILTSLAQHCFLVLLVLAFCHVLPLGIFENHVLVQTLCSIFCFSDAIINENYDYLKGFLEDLAPPERSGLIQDWETSGLVYLDYLRVLEMVHQIQQVPEFLNHCLVFLFPGP